MKKFGKKSSIGKIYKTTDGALGGDKSNKKPRFVISLEQRKSDGAVVVTKLHKQRGKDPTSSVYIQGIVLKDHPSLKEPTIVEKRAIFGKKDEEGYKPLFPQEMTEMKDRLNEKELRKVREGIQNDTEAHRKTYERTLKRWKKGFKE